MSVSVTEKDDETECPITRFKVHKKANICIKVWMTVFIIIGNKVMRKLFHAVMLTL